MCVGEYGNISDKREGIEVGGIWVKTACLFHEYLWVLIACERNINNICETSSQVTAAVNVDGCFNN